LVKRTDCDVDIRDSTGSLRISNVRSFVDSGCELRFHNPSGYVRHVTLGIKKNTADVDVGADEGGENVTSMTPPGDCVNVNIYTNRHRDSESLSMCNVTEALVSRNDTKFRLVVSEPGEVISVIEISYWTTIDVEYWHGQSTADADCPYGWLPYGPTCLATFFQPLSWEDAKADCSRRGSSLLTICDRGQDDFITQYLNARLVSTSPAF
jgi:hypothetical protein